MSSGINQSTWAVVNSINLEIQENERAQKRGQARIAEANHAQAQKKVAKDAVFPSAGDQAGTAAKGKGTEVKPQLPTPQTTFAGLKGEDTDESGQPQNGKTLGLIAIIGEVMALQAKSNSNFWSTLWKQASESMMMEVKFAPIIGNAIQSAYTAQSLSTYAQANMATEDGKISLCMFGAVMGAAIGGEIIDAISGESDVGEDVNAVDETGTAEVDASGTDDEVEMQDFSDNEENATRQTENDIDRAVSSEEVDYKTRAKRIGSTAKDIVKKAYTKISETLGKGMQNCMGADIASRGISGWFVDGPYKNIQAAKEAEEGQAQALSKEAEQYAQFYGQAFSRSDTLTQGTQQNLDYAMNILKSAADTITQTVTSMFRG